MKKITIRNRSIGEGQPIFIIAECGVTCNYDLKITKELIDVVHDSGADAIKFIFWFPDEIMSDRAVQYTYPTVDGIKTENMFEMLDKLRFSLDEWREIKSYADQKNVILFSTVNSPSGIDYAETIGLEAYKLSSWDFNYLPLWKKIAMIGKPMLIDTGPVSVAEVAKVIQVMHDAGNDQSILVHCFHTEDHRQMNMHTIPYMKKAFNSVVGYSATDYRDELDYMAVALGVSVLEKRLTLKRNLPGHHHAISKEPQEFKDYVQCVRNLSSSLGALDLIPSDGDKSERKRFFRHLVANCEIKKGTIITGDMLEGKRPEEGISPEFIDFFIGRAAKRDLAENEAITWDTV